MATGTITSLGIGSSLDIQGILDSLREADEATLTVKKNNITALESSRDSFNALNAILLDMKRNASALSLGSNFLARNVTISSDILSTSSSDGADIGTHTVEIERLASQSSFVSQGLGEKSYSVYVPTAQKSSEGFTTTDSDIVLAEDEQMTIVYGTGDDRQTITITGGVGGYTLEDLETAINSDAANDDGAGGTYVTASISEDEEGLFHLEVGASSGGTGEDNRVMITKAPESTKFAADPATFTYQIGDQEISIDVAADASLSTLAELINADSDNPGVTASVINTGYGDTPYQLVLKSDATGEDNRITIKTPLADLSMTEENGSGFVMASESVITFDSPVIIRQADGNTDFVFQEDTGNGFSADITATIEDGVYANGEDLAAAVEKAMEEASSASGSGIDYTVSWNENEGKLEISEAGALENLTIKWGDAGSTAAASLGFASDQTITPASASLNAFVTVDGIGYQRQANSGLSDLIPGMSLTLSETGSANVTVDEKTDDIKEDIQALVDLYNDLAAYINDNDDYDEDEQTWDSLAKYSSVDTMKNSLLSMMQTQIDLDGSVTSFFDLGLEISKDGILSLDETVLNKALSENFDDVRDFFTGTDTETGIAERLNDHLLEQTRFGGFIESETGAIDEKISNLENTIVKETERIEKKYDTLTQQFVEMDSYMREMESMQSYISKVFNATGKDKDN